MHELYLAGLILSVDLMFGFEMPVESHQLVLVPLHRQKVSVVVRQMYLM